jgi:hypothetical protein
MLVAASGCQQGTRHAPSALPAWATSHSGANTRRSPATRRVHVPASPSQWKLSSHPRRHDRRLDCCGIVPTVFPFPMQGARCQWRCSSRRASSRRPRWRLLWARWASPAGGCRTRSAAPRTRMPLLPRRGRPGRSRAVPRRAAGAGRGRRPSRRLAGRRGGAAAGARPAAMRTAAGSP